MKKIRLFLFFCLLMVNPAFSQTDSSATWLNIPDIGLFPKEEAPELYNFRASGYYRFFGTYTHLQEGYDFDPVNDKNVFIGDDSQLPTLMFNISGRPTKRSSWGFDLYTFQFLQGSINPAYSGHVPDSLRPSVYDPINGVRLGGNLGLHLGVNFYGNFETSLGSLGIKAGGIHWTSLSDLTLASFKGYNRFMLFEPNPWDPLGTKVKQRYTDFFESGNIEQDERWGEKAFVGLILEGANLPGQTSFKALFGKTELNGGYLYVPNFSYGGQVQKQFSKGYVGINTFNGFTYKDSLHTKTAGFNITTLETQLYPAGFLVHLEAGAGQYFAPSYTGGWGEALHLKIRTPENESGRSIELHTFRLSPEIINNSAVFWNTSIVEDVSSVPTETVGSAAVLTPFASSMVPLGMMTNNRQGYDINAELPLENFKISAAIGSSSEIDAISNQITYSHPVNQLTRSRFWRWNFPSNVGPYERYSVIFRDVYETVNLTDDSLGVALNKKHFSGVEVQLKASLELFSRDLYVFTISRISSAQKKWSPMPVFSEDAYIRQYSNELEAYWMLNDNVILNGYIGYERTLGNYDTEVNHLTARPRNQYGSGYGLGVDYSVGRNAVLMLRHRWFSFEDKNFEEDKFKGTETVLELKIMF